MLRDKAQRNGNINWDDGHEILVTFPRHTLVGSKVFEESACAEKGWPLQSPAP
jgi:hypothetical protein